MNPEKLKHIASQLEGEFHFDNTMRTLYATDASAYREKPLAVAFPKNASDIKKLIWFARAEGTSLIPRTAGTSLAGQVVGSGIVVDVSRTFTQILEVNPAESWVRVQPGVIRDELNLFLRPHGLYFGPETSTANRAMIGGMVGNNSCGSNSIVYGSAREHLLSVKAILSDGTEAEFGALTLTEFEAKCRGENTSGDLETRIYQATKAMLSHGPTQENIRAEFPKPSIQRRNTGYAIDLLLETEPFTAGKEPFNFCKLIAGSEGTLAFLTEIKLHVNPLPPKEIGLLCVHCETVDESLRANLVALRHNPSASELMDHYVLECTKTNIEQSQNRFFVQGDPGAILVVELTDHTQAAIQERAQALVQDLQKNQLGYHFPLVLGPDTKKVWNLRKAGLGLLSNIPGDAKPVAVIEDTAVDVEDLPEFIREFNLTLEQYNLYCVHYAHAGSGELHLRPIINLKTEEGNKLFRDIATEIAHLVKKYRGSLSGEHGDGRLRGEFIPFMIGEENYRLVEEVKRVWDPGNLFNPGKIVNTPSMNSSLRYEPGQETPEFDTVFKFHQAGGVLRAAELCNGSGDCRKTHLTGGTMCPSYMVTRHERDTTRARANAVREFLTRSTKANRFDHHEIKEAMDLCISCKGCKSECPSNVDVAKLKAEFQQHYYDANGIPFRTRLIANFNNANKLASLLPGAYNLLFKNKLTAHLFKKSVGFAPKRSLPLLHATTLKSWFKKHQRERAEKSSSFKKKVYLFCDEFTNYNDTPIGQKAVLLLERLGYEVVIPEHEESGRTYLSKGFVREAKKLAQRNVALLHKLISAETPLIGIEPSCILTFRDEYLDLVDADQLEDAKSLSIHCLQFDEFIARELLNKNIDPSLFKDEERQVKLHGHCHQKALSSVLYTQQMLTLPKNYKVEVIPSGCCGMAGSFGYEAEHFDVSMAIGELVLFPSVRAAGEEVIIAAPGTSCRHQIHDGTGKNAKHPIEVLYEALK
ncbi:FAD-binding and (Fe-S)-binding domain-containing protein [Rufibacter quisquiliarum]|uniref:FAD/FMN-containing dehydrogenase/Fe-S oxidoreductase n=1 Tax=Rufibacter quisquiliarum TaxID=1549639 RepID=A0A839GMA1_9BACT|nr:FAD-binding and (Fe-S)-binding domain-containing protein [Rufibacter quisquiliarum]MBA9077949.1 FAD/FMN-containing dehydrogenase/Fe-S oxidoreductase [Rufibacter quisquiliarum]